MKFNFSLFLILFSVAISPAQSIDTLSFFSPVFDQTRTVYIHKPDIYKYKSDTLKMPVVYLLDGQHEWFVNPILSDIEYLQNTHEIPNALVVVIPLLDRRKECEIGDLKMELPLHKFITQELKHELERYNHGDLRVLIGHSFSASFSLYSFLHEPEHYSAVFAHSPLDQMDKLLEELNKSTQQDQEKIYLSVGGISPDKDHYHRKNYNRLKTEFPEFFMNVNTFEADNSAHNAVPIVANPWFLTEFFSGFKGRYSKIAEVDEEYLLIEQPDSLEAEMTKLLSLSKINDQPYPPEIADLYGIASRYSYNGYKEYARKVYELGIEFFPNFYGFHLSLYEQLISKNAQKAKQHLNKAEVLLNTIDKDLENKNELLEAIKNARSKNGW
ncbi:alpha/beta hydrolase-fold protein [Salinimicrobium soli]|uniref:alpha/beta hydrolase-fold protein n=1 Tax=Salinimicrobium soli TaxID=1254399 RepID=UPI003AADED53